jgi:molecular chaperone HscA
MLKASFEYAEADVATRSLTEAKVDTQRVIDAVANAIALDGDRLLSQQERSSLNETLAEVQAIATNSERASEITAASERLAKASDEFASRRMDDSVRQALAGTSLDELSESIADAED